MSELDSEPYYPETMDVHVRDGRVTCVLGPDGEPVVYTKRYKPVFDLRRTPTPKNTPKAP